MTTSVQSHVLTQVADLCRTILEKNAVEIEPGMSLTRDLGFDSMQLMQFFAGIETRYPAVILEDWFIAHASGARDTVGSVADYIAGAFHQQIAAE
ncbi:acyl carrier protein [Microvirga terricola]|uniref:Acyl carrier protein n=1 Tax=Microvirga terricola TaxID=2719797 RepID=A0ABX0VD46_9HYPH|nr:acyl carrier protein [Microvirga terricola]NIX77587.1 acyl carrier protein [Microvirga terricola]